MKRRLISIATAAIMAVTMTSVNVGVVFADPGPQASQWKGAISSQDKQQDTKEYKEHQALVMFSNHASMTKDGAKNVFGTDSGDMSIEKVWNFDNADAVIDTPADEDGITTFAQGGDKGDVLNIALVKSKTLTTEQLIAKLKAMDGVVTAEPNYRIHMASNDAFYDRQWALNNTGQDDGTPGESTNIETRWASNTGSEEVVVAVVDTGIDYTHEDLKDNLWDSEPYGKQLKGIHGFDFINGDADPMDDNGHGTHCAGIIGAQANNGVGISGVNQDVSLMGLKILDESGGSWISYEVDAYNYINRALELGVPVRAINNSWGGGDSEIFGKLIELIGSKGAVTVVAAGNSAMNEDTDGVEYPQDPDNDYMISVAASTNTGDLAGFSNYGKTTVDVAAPGAGILSSVSYDNYLPTLYDSVKQDQLSKYFNDYEGTRTDLIPDVANGSDFVSTVEGKTAPEDICEISISDERAMGSTEGGHSLKLDFKNMKKGEYAAVTIPYELASGYFDENSKMSSHFNGMMRAECAGDDSGFCVLVDIPSDMVLNSSTLMDVMDYYYEGYYFDKNGAWNSIKIPCGYEGTGTDLNRKLVVFCSAVNAGDHTVYLDDMGISKENADPKDFGKYDYMSGTSMAAPVVTGAVALIAAEHPEWGKDNAQDLIAEVLGHVQPKENLADKVIEGGVLDFSANGGEAKAGKPRLGSATVDPETGSLTLKGRNLNDLVSLQFNDTDVTAKVDQEASNKTTLVVNASEYINRVVTIKVTTENGEVTKEKVYFVKGKEKYAKADIDGIEPWDAAVADNKNVYAIDASEGAIYSAKISSDSLEFDMLDKLTVAKLFGKSEQDNEEESQDILNDSFIEFVSQPAVIDGKVYALVSNSFGSEYESSDDDDDWFFFSTVSNGKVSYSSEYTLVSMDPALADDVVIDDEDDDEDSDSDDKNTATIASVIKVGDRFNTFEDVALASYNGKLYFIGGYDYTAKAPSTRVLIYDPKAKKWSEGPALPSGRAGGTALQTDSGLVYTMGYAEPNTSDEEVAPCPKNLIFDGTSWKESGAQLEPMIAADVITRGSNKYTAYVASVSLTKGGLVYTGVPCDGLGDTFLYNVNEDAFAPTQYNYITELDGTETFCCIATGSTLWGLTRDGTAKSFKIPSGNVKVQDKSGKGGKIAGAGKAVVPGSKVTLKPKASKGYLYKKSTFKVDGKAAGTSKAIYVDNNKHTATASFVRAVTKIKLSKTKATIKKGKTLQLKATVLPKNAANKKVTWKSSNKKFATVSSTGKVKALKKGKTVTITCMAKDGSKVKAKCKITIK